MYPTSKKNSRAHYDVISDEYITDKVQNQGGRAIQFPFAEI